MKQGLGQGPEHPQSDSGLKPAINDRLVNFQFLTGSQLLWTKKERRHANQQSTWVTWDMSTRTWTLLVRISPQRITFQRMQTCKPHLAP
eukprot:scaffold316_cov352-Pavlova_lutheri.AAC.29